MTYDHTPCNFTGVNGDYQRTQHTLQCRSDGKRLPNHVDFCSWERIAMPKEHIRTKILHVQIICSLNLYLMKGNFPLYVTYYLKSQNNSRCNIQVYNAIIVHWYLGCVTPTHHREEREVLQQTCAICDTDECFGAGHRLKRDGTIEVLS